VPDGIKNAEMLFKMPGIEIPTPFEGKRGDF